MWAPACTTVEVCLENPPHGAILAMRPQAGGFFGCFAEGSSPGDLYRFRLDGAGPFPDPASRFQPAGVHGPSEVVDPASLRWTDEAWQGVPLERLVTYELHVGTFTPRGTFAGVTDKLSELVDLGVTAIELMPVAEFPGRWNWGYDGVDLFAPAHRYGRPEDLARLVNESHRLGLAVLLDVVYNHVGPDGAYWSRFTPDYFSARHRTPWGPALNLDGPRSAPVRDFLIENALRWITEYHLDGLRLDATHALVDESPRHFLAELESSIRSGVERPVLLVAEDHRNLAALVKSPAEGGYGLDAVWSDDFHHEVHRIVTEERGGYYRDFTGQVADLATAIRDGWLFQGQHSEHYGGLRGTDPAGMPARRFVNFLQNHDQVGNRALGERLNHLVDPAAFRAATVLLLTAPESPLLFMGEEWAAPEPFLYFTDHEPELGRRVTEGRGRDLQHIAGITTDAAPDPQDPETFERCRLDWGYRSDLPHRGVLHLHRALLRLRREDPLFRDSPGRDAVIEPLEEDGLILRYILGGREALVVVRLRGAGPMALPASGGAAASWRISLSTEDSEFTANPHPIHLLHATTGAVLEFARPGALIFLC